MLYLEREDGLRLLQLISECGEFESVTASELEGLLFGIKCGPKNLTPGDWLPVLFGPKPGFETEALAREAYGLAATAYKQIDRVIEDGHGAMKGVAFDAAWLEGLLTGFDISGDAWKPWFGNSVELEELVAPFFALADHYGVGAAEEKVLMEQALHDSAVQALPGLLVELHRFWRATPVPEKPTESGAQS